MSSSTVLSGEKMVLTHSKTNFELPPVGVKEFEPNHSWLEQKQIQSALDSRKTLLEAERIEKECNLMTADWRPERQKALVSRKGKHWETFGHHADDADWLFPEEVLFLMEMNCLQCIYGEVPLSLQKGYSVLLKPENGCTLDEYRVFAHLCRAGYRVLRHLPNLTVTAYEKTIRLDQHLRERKTYSNIVEEVSVMETEEIGCDTFEATNIKVSENMAKDKTQDAATEKLKENEINVRKENVENGMSSDQIQASSILEESNKKFVDDSLENNDLEKGNKVKTGCGTMDERKASSHNTQDSDSYKENSDKMVEVSVEDKVIEKSKKRKTDHDVTEERIEEKTLTEERMVKASSHNTQDSDSCKENSDKMVEVSVEDKVIEKSKKRKTDHDVTEERIEEKTLTEERMVKASSHNTQDSDSYKENSDKMVEVSVEDKVIEKHNKRKTDHDVTEERIEEKTLTEERMVKASSHNIQDSDSYKENSDKMVEVSVEDKVIEKHKKRKTDHDVTEERIEEKTLIVTEERMVKASSHNTQDSDSCKENSDKMVEVSVEDKVIEKHKKRKTDHDVTEERIEEKTLSVTEERIVGKTATEERIGDQMFDERIGEKKCNVSEARFGDKTCTTAEKIILENSLSEENQGLDKLDGSIEKIVEDSVEGTVIDKHKNIDTGGEVSEERVLEKTFNDKDEVSDALEENSVKMAEDSSEEMVVEDAEDCVELEKNDSRNSCIENVPRKTLTNITEVLTKRKLRKIHRKHLRLTKRTGEIMKNVNASRKTLEFINMKKGCSSSIGQKYKSPQKKSTTQNQSSGKQNVDSKGLQNRISSLFDAAEAPVCPPERWQPPVVISEIPEDVEVRIGYAPSPVKEHARAKEPIEVIDIASSSEEDEEEDQEESEETNEVESDSDIEIIQEITPSVYEDTEEEDDFEIIEVPVPEKEIIVETLSSDSEEENSSGSESEKSYDGNWKRNGHKKKKFERPLTMRHLTFAAVDEFCAETKPSEDDVDSVRSSNLRTKRPVFQVEKTRDDILDSMPTMAGKNQKLMTLYSPDLRLIPDSIILKQPSYTYSTNVLRARVFRQGFRGRRNFHGMRFPSYNPYYNNNTGNFYPNQTNFGGNTLFQTPQLNQILGGGDITSVARGVMQIASALWMNMPQNNMNNGLIPYNNRPRLPIMHQNYPPMSTNPFPPVNNNFSYNEPNINHNRFNSQQRNITDFDKHFDMPQQSRFGTQNHIRFSNDSNSPVVENNQNFTLDLSRSSDSELEVSDANFNHPITNNHRSAGRHYGRAANFRNKRGRFPRSHQHDRGGFPQRNSRGRSSDRSPLIDPAYIKPDVPIPGEQNSNSRQDLISLASSNSSKKPIEIISIDDNDDNLVPRVGMISKNAFRKERKRIRKMKMKEGVFKKRCPNPNSIDDTVPEIVFLDSPSTSNATLEHPSSSVKQENETDVKVKSELLNEQRKVKQEEAKSMKESMKRESEEGSTVKVENQSFKTEENSGETSNVIVNVRESGQNVKVEIKIESSSDTSSVVSLPLANLVKEEPSQVKKETVEIKSEDVHVDSVKTEDENGHEPKESIIGSHDSVDVMVADSTATFSESRDTGDNAQVMVADSTKTVSESMAKSNNVEVVGAKSTEFVSESVDTCDNETEGTRQSDTSNQSDNNIGVDSEEENDTVSCLKSRNSCDRTDLNSKDSSKETVSSWAEIKKHNLPLSTFQEADSHDESENEEEEEIRPLLRPKHCKTIGSVLSALQIFSPITASPSEVVRLKISFDLYLPAEFRKSHRGLPQYRIVVFSGSEPLPSPAQLREVNHRFQDRVPILTAIVAPGSVVFYTFSDIELPQDTTSYSK